MKAPKNNKQAILNVSMRCFTFIILAWMLYAAWHERYGPFMFFEQMDPPAADPHRSRHLRDAYFLIYGGLGVLLGSIASIGVEVRHSLVTVTLGACVFFVMRYRGLPQFLNPHSEEGYFGGPALLLSALATMTLYFFIRRILPARGQLPTQ